jgi:hypothetical protein
MSDGGDPLLAALRRGWVVTGEGWELRSTDETERAVITPVVGDYEARVYRWPTGPGRHEAVLAHGPRVFESVEEALAYSEANVAPRPGNPGVAVLIPASG